MYAPTAIAATMSVFALSGCGGSAAGNEGLFGAPVPVTQSSNGLPFANSNSKLTDLRNHTLTTKIVDQYLSGGGGVIQINTEAVSFTSGTSADDLQISSITIDGISHAVNGDGAFTANGMAFEVFVDDYDGLYVTSMGYIATSPGLARVGLGIAGLETSPAHIPTSGSATYDGSFTAIGLIAIDETVAGTFVMESDITLNANFASGGIGGDTSNGVVEYSDSSGLTDDTFRARFVGGEITENGYEGDLLFTCDAGFVCENGSQFSGAFYGPDAAETGGLATIDLTQKNANSGETFNFDGTGAFVAD